MIRVLVVDDDFMVAKVHAAFVDRTPGFEVAGVAHNGQAALAAVAELHPDLVLLDIHLPDLSGIEVLHRLRELAPDVDVLVITAAKEVETVRTALRGGVVNYLLKPFDQEALRDRLQQYAAAHTSLAVAATIGQTDLDKLFGSAPPRARSGTTRLPKGLSPESAELVARVLRSAHSDDGLSSSECAELTGLSRVSARRYLEYFVEIGRAEVRLRYGAAGRPQRRYAWRETALGGHVGRSDDRRP
jgi:response regulator of citrate/malate metabolism